MSQMNDQCLKHQPYRRGKVRFLMLFLVSMALFGSEYAFNNPQALQVNMEKDLGIGETQFQLLYTIFSFPNIFATFFIGFLNDLLGVRIGLISLAIGMVVFQFVIAIGGYMYSYTTILIGRMFFGLASESTITAISCIVSLWFKGKELSLAFGIAVTFPEVGNALNSYLTPLIYEKTQSLGTSLLVSVFICTLGLICALIAVYIDISADKYDQEHKVEANNSNHEQQDKKIRLNDLKQLNPTFWLLIILSMFAAGLYVPFLDGANRLFVQRFCFTPVTAGRALVVTYLISAICSPPIGMLVDYFGHKRHIIILTMVLFTAAQFIILIYPQCAEGSFSQKGAISGLALLGIGYCLYGNCLVPSVSLVVKRKITGTAFGIMLMIESAALAFFPVINGELIEKGERNSNNVNGYHNSSLFFFLVGVTGSLISLGLFFIPDKFKNKLDRSSIQNQEQAQDPTESQSENSSDEKAKQTIEIMEISSNNLNTNLLSTNQENHDL